MHRYCWRANRSFSRSSDKQAVRLTARSKRDGNIRTRESDGGTEREGKDRKTDEKREREGGGRGEPDSRGGRRLRERQRVSARKQGGRANNRRRARRSLVAILLVHLFADPLFVFAPLSVHGRFLCASRRHAASHRIASPHIGARGAAKGATRRTTVYFAGCAAHVQLSARSSSKRRQIRERQANAKLPNLHCVLLVFIFKYYYIIKDEYIIKWILILVVWFGTRYAIYNFKKETLKNKIM